MTQSKGQAQFFQLSSLQQSSALHYCIYQNSWGVCVCVFCVCVVGGGGGGGADAEKLHLSG